MQSLAPTDTEPGDAEETAVTPLKRPHPHPLKTHKTPRFGRDLPVVSSMDDGAVSTKPETPKERALKTPELEAL